MSLITRCLGWLATKRPANVKAALAHFEALVVLVPDVRNGRFEVDLVQLGFQHISRIAVAVSARCASVCVADKGLADQQIQLLPAKLIDEGMSEPMKGQVIVTKSAKPEIAFFTLA